MGVNEVPPSSYRETGCRRCHIGKPIVRRRQGRWQHPPQSLLCYFPGLGTAPSFLRVTTLDGWPGLVGVVLIPEFERSVSGNLLGLASLFWDHGLNGASFATCVALAALRWDLAVSGASSATCLLGLAWLILLAAASSFLRESIVAGWLVWLAGFLASLVEIRWIWPVETGLACRDRFGL